MKDTHHTGIILTTIILLTIPKLAHSECRRHEMDFDIYCKILCVACKNDCYTPCIGNLTHANCDSTEALAFLLTGICDRIRQVSACDTAAACCRSDLRPCAVNLYNSVHGK